MTIAEVIAKASQYRPNNKAEDSDIIRWINEVDSRIKTDIYDAYLVPCFYIPYDMGTPTSKVLMAPVGFDRLYEYWVNASIDYLQGDTERYNQNIALFNELFEEYSGYCARNMLPKHKFVRYF